MLSDAFERTERGRKNESRDHAAIFSAIYRLLAVT